MNWGVIVAIVLTVGFGIATLVLALRLAKRKKPVWAYKSKKIIGLGTNVPPELKLTFSGTLVNDVYQTNFIFFNNGNEAIRQDDVTEKVILQFKGAEILRQPSIKQKSSEAIRFSAKQVVKNAENSVELDFLYLDHKDGAVVEVMHTECKEIACATNIIGARKVANIGQFEQFYRRFLGIRTSLAMLCCIAIVAYFIVAFLGYPGSNWSEYLEEHKILYIPSAILGGVGGFSFALLQVYLPRYIRGRKFPKWSRLKE